MKYKALHLQSGDINLFRELIKMFAEAFEQPGVENVPDAYLAQLLNNHNFIAYAALLNNTVIGGLTAYILPQYYGQYAEAYIYDIAVKSDFRGKGTGKMLLKALADFCRQNDIKTMFTEAHKSDRDAVKFYRSAGGEEEKVAHFNFYI